MMIKTLYKEKCLRYFIVPDIISIIIFLFYVPVDPLWILTDLLNNTIKNRFWNLPISWILFKIIIFFTHVIVLGIFIKFIDKIIFY